MTSVALPAVSGTIRRIGLVGQACADSAQAGIDINRKRAGAASAAAVRCRGWRRRTWRRRTWRRVGFAVIVPSWLPFGLACPADRSLRRVRWTLTWTLTWQAIFSWLRALGMI